MKLIEIICLIGIMFAVGWLCLNVVKVDKKFNKIKKQCKEICINQTVSDFYICANACYQWER